MNMASKKRRQDSAEAIASDLMSRLKSGRIKKISIDTIRRACCGDQAMTDRVLRLIVEKVG